MNKKLTVVISVYNESEALPAFFEAISKENSYIEEKYGQSYEVLYVNDGSIDGSLDILRKRAAEDEHTRVISFSRNFGHEAAMIAGIDHADGDYIICMDADLQHPVRCIEDITDKFEEGFDAVSMVRTSNADAGIIKNITSSVFYSVFNGMSREKMEKNASDFFGISKNVADVLKKDYRERIRFIRGYVQTVGFRKTVLYYKADDRIAGKSKYSIGRLFGMSMNAIMCFSDAPLKLGIYAGIIATVMGVIMSVYTIITWAVSGTPGGYATIIVLLCFMFAVLFFILGIIGCYISVIFAEIKNRPIYIIQEEIK